MELGDFTYIAGVLLVLLTVFVFGWLVVWRVVLSQFPQFREALKDLFGLGDNEKKRRLVNCDGNGEILGQSSANGHCAQQRSCKKLYSRRNNLQQLQVSIRTCLQARRGLKFDASVRVLLVDCLLHRSFRHRI